MITGWLVIEEPPLHDRIGFGSYQFWKDEDGEDTEPPISNDEGVFQVHVRLGKRSDGYPTMEIIPVEEPPGPAERDGVLDDYTGPDRGEESS